MNNNNETIKDIVAEMRDPNSGFCRWYADGGSCDCPKCAFDALADRIEAAWKRDRSSAIKAAMMAKCEICKEQGNAAKMREALEHIEKLTREFNAGNYSRPDYTQWVIDSVRFALAAPARNCDRYGDEDDAFAAWHDSLNDGDVVSVRNAFNWLFSRAEGGAE